MIDDVSMAHQRKLIRHAVVALLTGATAAGTRVQGTRTEPLRKGKVAVRLPAISVYTLSDPVDDSLESANEDMHLLELKITGWLALSGAADLDDADAMDDLAEQIETAMSADLYLGGTVAKCRLAGTAISVVEDDGASDPKIGVVTLTYVAQYSQSVSQPDALDEFLRAKATYSVVGGVPDTVPAAPEFNVRIP